ncbi:hypothetical protein KAR02_03655, partial [Candidatus Bipolaricaulota bacterium]|nr:hypothetical protein [Candidatus Bipolaricaulota bacterium]
MKGYRFSVSLFAIVFLGLALPLAAQSDSQFLGTFSEPFTTFAVTGDLVHPGELDWYMFDITDDAPAIFILAASEGDPTGIRVLLFDVDETYIDASDSGYLEIVLDAGSYRLRIDSSESAVQNYSLLVFNGLEVESNDGVIESNDLGELSGSLRLFASMLPAGDADFYRFQISETGLPGGANALLISTNGPELGDSILILYQFDETEDRYLPIAFDDDSGDSYWSRLLVRPQAGDRFALRVEETT